MFDLIVLQDWAGFAIRWLHVITGIAWIGSSFYFIALDLGLRKPPCLPPGVSGEEWQVHGGGFYRIQKYTVAPQEMPDHLTWFKWESYATWLSGFVLLCLVYYAGAELYLIDPTVMELSVPVAIAISLGSLAFGWIAYDRLCKSRLGDSEIGLMLVLFGLLVVMAWGYANVFSGRAALLHLGAFTATIMSANVFFIIIPNQKIVVADLKAGRTPAAELGRVAKQRSTHNNYLTLPVLFLMLSTHAPLAFASEYNWLIACLVFLMGVSIRHFFNTMHARKGTPVWTWGITAALFAGIVWLSMAGYPEPYVDETVAAPSEQEQVLASTEGFAEVHEAVVIRCSMCHAEEPAWPGLAGPPKGVVLETEAQVLDHAREIYLHSGITHAMPPGNLSYMEPEERRLIVRWFRAGTGNAL